MEIYAVHYSCVGWGRANAKLSCHRCGSFVSSKEAQFLFARQCTASWLLGALHVHIQKDFEVAMRLSYILPWVTAPIYFVKYSNTGVRPDSDTTGRHLINTLLFSLIGPFQFLFNVVVL